MISSAAETYGPLPEEVENLIIIAELKNLCKKLEIINLKLNKSGCALTFKDLNSLSNGGVMQAVNDFSDRVKISFYTNPVVTITGEEAKEIAEFSLRFLNYAKEKAN